ncbi:MAG: hypothetical protein PHE80_02415, partial [Candidatus Omnitrophica bacterium]|nr:hypothetical protein [Candidatus Omnitrophota bacterium]
MAKAIRRDYFEIPSCAWKRALGDIPEGAASSCPNRGIALGGFGAGSFMYSISGTFGPWSLKAGSYDQWWLDSSAFHFREKVGEKEERIRTLSTDPALKTKWEKL